MARIVTVGVDTQVVVGLESGSACVVVAGRRTRRRRGLRVDCSCYSSWWDVIVRMWRPSSCDAWCLLVSVGVFSPPSSNT